jgi:hypothetical protein
MKSGVSRKVRMGTSLITALTMSASGIILSNPTTHAIESQLQLLASRAACSVLHGTGLSSVRAYTSDCYQVQAAVKCQSQQYSYIKYWEYGSKSKDSRAYCPRGYSAIKGAKRAKATPTSPWWDWYYFDM